MQSNPYVDYHVFDWEDEYHMQVFLANYPKHLLDKSWKNLRERLLKHARTVNKAATVFQDLHTEVRFRPGHSGALEAKLEFEEALARLPKRGASET